MSALFSGFLDAARRHGDRPAVCVAGDVWRYRQLLDASDRVARFLAGIGAEGADGIVALASVRALATYPALLGILKSGNGYLPVSLDWPPSRIAAVLERSGATGLFADAAHAGPIAEGLGLSLDDARHVTLPSSSGATLAYFGLHNGGADHRGQNNEYLMYTSGSTGKPKGIAVSDDNARALVHALAERFPLLPSDRCVQMADLSFDFSVGELFPCWHAGAALHVPTRGQALGPGRFIRDAGITVWTSVPSRIRTMRRQGQLAAGAFPQLRLSLFCGEVLPVGLVRDWERAAPKSAIANLYGPTEATVFATGHVWTGEEFGLPNLPIGTPLGEMRWRIEPVPGGARAEGHRGELLLSGPQVVQGYWDDSEKSAAAFTTDKEGLHWYRTGDLVEYDPAFGLSFLGRLDFQVKARGYRIELEEVARVVAESTGTDAPAVVPVVNEEGLCDCLVAFYEAPGHDEAVLRSRCAKRLPGFMVPRRFFALDEFPKTANGKTDLNALARQAAALLQTESLA